MTALGELATNLGAEDVVERTNRVLAEFVAEHSVRLGECIPEGDPMYDALVGSLADFLDKGKRLRPLFCYWGWRGAGGLDDDRIITAGAALELLHAFALIHDDLVDRSDLRRGAPSVHRRHAQLHERFGMHGPSDVYGNAVALLLGDLCLGWFHELLDECGLSAHRRQRARRLMATAFSELVAGQYLDLAEQNNRTFSVERSAWIIRYKTAKYTVERPLHLGGVLAGADTALLNSYSGYALPVGEAFQLRDDLLGAFGEPEATGKPDADDIRTGKPTMLMAITLDRADPVRRAEILRRLDGPEMDESAVAMVRAVMVDTGAVAAIEQRIAATAATARRALDTLDADGQVRDVLSALIDTAAYRSA